MAGNSDMEISDDDRPPPSSVGSCLQTHPPTHPEAHDFLSSLATDGDGVLPGDGSADEAGAGVATARAGVCPGTRPVEPEGAAGRPGGATGIRHGNGTVDAGAQISSERSRQRRNRRKREGWIARRAAKTADSFLT